MSTLKSNNENMTINADGASSEVKFQANGVEKASISSAGAFTSTTIDATALTGNLPAISGASLTGFTDAQMPSGSVLQVLSTQTMAGISTTSDAFQAAGWYLDITPISTSSKILVTLNGGGQYVGNSAGVTQYVTIYRDSTNLGDSTYGLSRFSTPGGSWALAPHSCAVLDSPSSTSSIRYQPYFRRADNSGTVYFSSGDRGKITLTVMEIAG